MDLKRVKQFIEFGSNKKILHLGCMDKPIKGTINIDYVNFLGVDKLLDLNKRWSFKDNSIDAIIASHLLEHINYFHFMNETLRVLKKGGKIYLLVPYFTNHRAHMGEHETHGFSWVSFEQFRDKRHPFYQLKIISNKILFGNKLGFLNKIVNKFQMLYDRFLCYLLPATELEIVLEKRKEE